MRSEQWSVNDSCASDDANATEQLAILKTALGIDSLLLVAGSEPSHNDIGRALYDAVGTAYGLSFSSNWGINHLGLALAFAHHTK